MNISLLAFGLYEWQEVGFSFLATSSFRPQVSKLYRQSGKELPTLTQSLRELEALDYTALLAMLTDTTQVAEGYKKRDVSLGMLSHKYYFDVHRALGTDTLGRLLFTYTAQNNESAGIVLYTDLTDEQFVSVIEFVKNEKWPYTPQGLLVQYKEQQDPLLKELFLQTNEYRCVEMVLGRGTQVSRDTIFDFVTAVDYKVVRDFYNEMVKAQDFSADVRRGFLLNALPQSAEILFKTDPRFCLHSVTDKQALMFLAEFNKNPDMAEEYALGLLEAPRSKAVWNRATLLLCEKLGLNPETENRNTLLERFGRYARQTQDKVTPMAIVAPDVKLEVKQEPEMPVAKTLPKIQKPQVAVAVKPPAVKAVAKASPQAPKATPQAPKLQTKAKSYEIVYVVKSGDTLWHIAKRYGMSIDKIKKHNKLTSDTLKPGSMLRIPQEPKQSAK